jgi:hypothetical protein
MKKDIVISSIVIIVCVAFIILLNSIATKQNTQKIEQERIEKIKQDSVTRAEFIRDSIIKKEIFVRDSLTKVFYENFMKTPQPKCRVKEDDYRTITWYNNPYFTTLNNYNYFTIYLGKDTQTDKVWIVNRVSINLWNTFSNRLHYVNNGIYLIIDDESYTIHNGYTSVTYLDGGPDTAIDFDTSISTDLIIKIIKSKNPIQIVIYGDKGYKPLSRTLTRTEIQAIKAVYYQYLLLTKQ